MAAQPAIQASEQDESPIPGSDVVPISRPDISHLITEDDEPVDSILSEKQQRLLTEPLYSSWSGPLPEEDGLPRFFLALANVGFFPTPENPALVPDMLLSADVQVDEDLTKKENRSYFQWRHGKAPDVVVELVSNRKGGELGERFRRYRRAGVSYYVVYDPLHRLGEVVLHAFQLAGNLYQRMGAPRFETLGLALIEWHGTFENHTGTWLRWCTLDGKLIPTGAERAEEAGKRAEDADKRAEEAGKRAEDADKRAEDERKRAEDADKRAALAEERMRQLEEMLRAQSKV
jgi:hypothetical protein